MDMDTEYGFIVNSDKNKAEFTRAVVSGFGSVWPLAVTFFHNVADCIWNTGLRTTYTLVPVGMVELDTKPKEGTCPKCHDEGRWVRTALVCNQHGVFGGF